MKSKKCFLFFIVLSLLIISSVNTLAASGAIGYNYSTDTTKTQSIYYANNWSTLRFWEYGDIAIPDNAVVTGVAMKDTMNPSYGYSGFNMALYKEDGYGYFLTYTDTIYHYFDGEPVKQLWQSRFYVTSWSHPGYALTRTPQLVIYYEY